MRPSVRTTRTAWVPKIVWKLAAVRKVLGSSTPNTTMTRPHTRIRRGATDTVDVSAAQRHGVGRAAVSDSVTGGST